MIRITRTTALALTAVITILTPHQSANAQGAGSPPFPTSAAQLGAFDAAIANSAGKLIGAPSAWNRHGDRGDCPDSASSWTIRCALEHAGDKALAPYTPASSKGPMPEARCDFRLVGSDLQGSCGAAFDAAPALFNLRPSPREMSGAWRSDMAPTAVWVGSMTAADDPLTFEARQLLDSLYPGKYRQPLIEFNGDSTVTFASMQHFFTLLSARLRAHAAQDLGRAADSVEIDGYAGGTGVIRLPEGWFPVNSLVASSGRLTLRIYADTEVSPSDLDRKILVRAAMIITSNAAWNRADNRQCPATATTWSIYCAIEKAEVDVTGAFHHRRPAMELVRVMIEERTKNRKYQHRLMDYNNDPTTTLDEVQRLFQEAIAKIKG